MTMSNSSENCKNVNEKFKTDTFPMIFMICSLIFYFSNSVFETHQFISTASQSNTHLSLN